MITNSFFFYYCICILIIIYDTLHEVNKSQILYSQTLLQGCYTSIFRV